MKALRQGEGLLAPPSPILTSPALLSSLPWVPGGDVGLLPATLTQELGFGGQ